MIKHSPLISIILPTYNGKPQWLSQAIESIINQTYQNWELIIINDASTNEIEKTIIEYASKDKRLHYIKNKKNLKLTKTLNKGLKIVKGIYIARIDDDDIWIDNNKLERQVEFMENNLDYGLCGTGVILINEQGEVLYTLPIRKTDIEIRNHMLQSNQIAHPSVLFRKKIIHEIGGYDPKMNLTEDYDLRCKVGKVAKLYNLEEVHIQYRINTNSVSQKNIRKQRNMSFKVFRKNKSYYPNFLRALILRCGEYFLPLSFTQYVLSKFK